MIRTAGLLLSHTGVSLLTVKEPGLVTQMLLEIETVMVLESVLPAELRAEPRSHMAVLRPTRQGSYLRVTFGVARFLPNPAGDLLRRVDRSLTNAEDTMERVDGQLTEVNSKLGDVGGTLATAGTTLGDATAVLREVRSLLAELQSELALLRQVPELAAKLDDIHRIVTELASRP